jgi:IclR family KDG regulon transcriptional repressor
MPIEERFRRYIVPAIERAVRVIETLGSLKKDASLAELYTLTKVPKSSLFRILLTLEDQGMVQQDRERKKFSLGVKLVELGAAKLGRIDFTATARPFLEQLANETHESVYLGVLDHGQVILVQHIDSQDMWKVVTRLGNTSPAHCTAIGQVLLAGLKEEEVSKMFSGRGLEKYTKTTISTMPALRKRLAQVRAQDFAVVDGEYKPDLCAVAAPVRDHTGNVVAAVMIAIHSNRQDKKTAVPRLAKTLRRTGAEISRHLGYKLNKTDFPRDVR